mmetsp:Transcript_11300/g.20324  ORF Transcript_11300/g.20324 Transcript_11300/m.20324 type:complete len:255 (+) Transcript_11300:632-1396(+)
MSIQTTIISASRMTLPLTIVHLIPTRQTSFLIAPRQHHAILPAGQKIDTTRRGATVITTTAANFQIIPRTNNGYQATNIGQMSAQNEIGISSRFLVPSSMQRMANDLTPGRIAVVVVVYYGRQEGGSVSRAGLDYRDRCLGTRPSSPRGRCGRSEFVVLATGRCPAFICKVRRRQSSTNRHGGIHRPATISFVSDVVATVDRRQGGNEARVRTQIPMMHPSVRPGAHEILSVRSECQCRDGTSVRFDPLLHSRH